MFTSTSLMVAEFTAAVDSPFTLTLAEATQLKVVPGMLAERLTARVCPLQIVATLGFVINGLGLTVTVTVCGVPAHPLKDGVTV